MTRRSPSFKHCAVAVLGLLLATVVHGAAQAASRPKPNIILILADDLGYGEIGAYGGQGIPTPHIDALARSGAVLTDGYMSAPQCSPSRAGMLTGRYQQRFGHHNNPPPRSHPAFARFGLPTSEITVAQELQQRGYVTGLVGKWHLGFKPEHFPLRRGFDEFFGFLEGGHVYLGREPDNPIYRGWNVVQETQYLTRAFGRESAAFIRRHARAPFFLYASFNAVHLPLQAESPVLKRFSNITDPKRRLFAAMLTQLDDAVGEIVSTIQAQGLAQDTLIVFAGDNGCVTAKSTCLNTPLRGAKGMLYEGGIRVPFIASWPGTIPAGRRPSQPVMAPDLFPTFLAAASGQDYANPRLNGVNLLPLLTGRSTAAPHDVIFWGSAYSGAVRKGDWKLLELPPNATQLYNVRLDKAETRNLAASQPALVRDLRNARAAWLKTLVPPLWPAQ